MFSYYYNVLKETFDESVSLVYTDTDSLIVKLKTEDLTSALEKVKTNLDTSNIHPLHPLYTKEHQAELFYMKLEMGLHKIIGK